MSGAPPPEEPHGPLRPVRRSYGPRSGQRDRDLSRVARNVEAAAWSLAGAMLGMIAGLRIGHPLLGALVGWAVCFLVTRGIVGASGAAATILHAPSGTSTPHAPEHSRAVALAARGRYPEAVAAFREAVDENPADPTPHLGIARIHRDHLGDPEGAARWFRRALREADMPGGMAVLVRRELVELYLHRMEEPRRAAPELARMAQEWAGTEQGEWAARELAVVKKEMWKEE